MSQEVEFHIGLDDKPGYACRLLRKAHARRLRVVVCGAPAALGRLDALLWTFEPGEFLPHARLRAGEAIAPMLARTPIWLTDDAALAGPAEVLLNLGPDLPSLQPGWGRRVELVAQDEADLQAGRQRWRQYKAAGLVPRDVRQPASGPAA